MSIRERRAHWLGWVMVVATGTIAASAVLSRPFATAQVATPAPSKLRGTVGGSGGVTHGHGFTVTFTPAGSNGSTLPGTIDVANGSNVVNASTGQNPQFKTQLVPFQYVRFDGAFWQVQSIASNTQLTLTTGYFGGTKSGLSVEKDMTLFSEYDVAFTVPFRETPTLVVSAQGYSISAGQTPSVNLIQRTDVTRSGFHAFLYQYPFGPYLPGGTADFDFVATTE